MKNTKMMLQCGFTILEMLAVMFLIGIVFSITLPALGPMLGNMRLNTSGENLANVLESARQHAITTGEDCYVVFPMATNTDMDYAAYKIYIPNSGTIGRWEILPKGIKISEDSTFISGTTSVPFPDDNDPQQNLVYIECKSNGGFSPGGSGNNATITLYEVNDTTGRRFNKVVIYNTPQKVKVKGIGEE